MRLRRYSVLLVTMLAVSFGVHGQGKTANSASIDRLIRQRMLAWNIPGVSLSISRNGKLIKRAGYGTANLEARLPVSTGTVFQIMSISKTFTAVLVMALVEDGKVSLDDPISKFVSGLPEAWRLVTVRHALTHTSGIPGFATLGREPCPVDKHPVEYDRDDVLKEVSCFPLEFQPGEQFKYGDTGYHLLGLMIENVAGRPYSEFLRSGLLDRLRMNATRTVTYREIIADRAIGYRFRDGVFENARRFEFDEFASGGIMSTADDMAKFEEAFTTNKVLSRASREQMLTNARLNNGDVVTSYGLGVGLTPFRDNRRAGHTGGSLGFATAFTHFPEKRLTVVLLSNAEQPGGRFGDLANEIAAMYF